MITKKDCDSIPPETTIWDEGKGSVSGFYVRRQKGPGVTFGLFYRTRENRQRSPAIGRYGSPWTPDTARVEARRWLGVVAAGGDPGKDKTDARRAETVAELADAYIKAAETGEVLYRRKRKKASTIATDKGRIERHIKPLLGRLKVGAVTSDDIEIFRRDVTAGKTAARIKTGPRGVARVTGGKGTATRTLALLSVIFSYAVKKRLRADNPVRGVESEAYAKKERRLSPEEYQALDAALSDMPEAAPSTLAAIRLLAFTGWRRGEALGLRWAEVNETKRVALLPDTKTGQSLRPLSEIALQIILAQPRRGDLVFPSSRDPEKIMGNFNHQWEKVQEKAGLPDDVTPHTLRHSFASEGGDLGYTELTIGTLIGHKKHSITAGYIHSADAVLLSAADAIAGEIAKKMAARS